MSDGKNFGGGDPEEDRESGGGSEAGAGPDATVPILFNFCFTEIGAALVNPLEMKFKTRAGIGQHAEDPPVPMPINFSNAEIGAVLTTVLRGK